MRESEAPTLRQFKIPTVLIIGGSESLVGAVSEAAVSLQVLVSECALEDAPTTAAQLRPLLLVVPRDVYRSDADSLEALATDVRALVMQVHAEMPSDELQGKMSELMASAEAKRPSWTGDPGL